MPKMWLQKQHTKSWPVLFSWLRWTASSNPLGLLTVRPSQGISCFSKVRCKNNKDSDCNRQVEAWEDSTQGKQSWPMDAHGISWDTYGYIGFICAPVDGPWMPEKRNSMELHFQFLPAFLFWRPITTYHYSQKWMEMLFTLIYIHLRTST